MILNTGPLHRPGVKGFMAWRDFAEKNPDLPVGFVIQGATTTDLPDEVVAAYEAPFPTAESKAGRRRSSRCSSRPRRAPRARRRCGNWAAPALDSTVGNGAS